MLEMVKMISDESTERHWKINGITEDVKCMLCGLEETSEDLQSVIV